tara:strand:+ start:375 stop:1496 length:1122 start_codon:yes stop_codon:yes gene_type:complete
MAQSYTPGLKVLANTPSEKVRQLPLKGEVLVEVGDSVSADTVVASTHIPGNVQMLNVARQLNVEAETVPDCMLVKIDENIVKGQIIAESKGFFGYFKSQLKSPIDGTLANVSNITGQALLSEPPIAIEVDAFSAGTIKEIIPEEGVIVNSNGALVQGILGIGGESHGEIVVVVNSRNDMITKEMLNESHANKIVIAGAYLPLDVFRHAQTLGVNGIVVGGFDYNALSSILGYNLGVAVTGSENLGISLMLTEGFGEIAMAEGTFNLFKQFVGKFASINGSTQIRAGVIRPEVMIPHTEDIESTELKESDMIISENSPVRVIRAPYFGKVGTVVSLPAPLVQMESEAMVRVAEVKFEDGDVVTIPRANLEMILH